MALTGGVVEHQLLVLAAPLLTCWPAEPRALSDGYQSWIFARVSQSQGGMEDSCKYYQCFQPTGSVTPQGTCQAGSGNAIGVHDGEVALQPHLLSCVVFSPSSPNTEVRD